MYFSGVKRMLKRRLLVSAAAVWLVPGFAAAADLELKRVMLSTGGVGYFEYEAKVSGDDELTLTVRLDQVDDVMKSLVVFDDKGAVGEVSLPGRQPLGDAFRELPFGPEAMSSPVALLDALRGAEVTVTGSRTLTGRILSVTAEDLILPNNGGTVTRTRVSLMTAGGVSQFILEEADSLSFTDPTLQAAVDKALSALAAQGARDSRVLTLRAPGEGERTVTVAYVVETPLWKTSYRLTLPNQQGGGGSAELQGWAILENMSGEDWRNVELTLVSGNPVTFRQALYDSYYVDRAAVPVEVVGRILPPVDEQQQLRKAGGSAAYDQGGDHYAESVAAPAPMPQAASAAEIAAAEATESATQVVFRMPGPVTVPQGHSLLVPFIDRAVPAVRVAYYLPEVQPTHPLAAVLLSNDGENGLPPGVVTLYERDAAGAVTYVGDARLGTLPAGERRLLSFAVDQKVSIRQDKGSTQTLTEVKISGGVMTLNSREIHRITYEIQGAAREDRAVLLEQARWNGWTLVEPAEQQLDVTPQSYRALVFVDAGGKQSFAFALERPVRQRFELINLDDRTLLYYLEAQNLPDAAKQALQQLVTLREELARQQREFGDIEAQLDHILQDQERIRRNLASVPSESDLQRRYLEELNKQEDELARLRAASDQKRQDIAAAEQAIADYIKTIEI